MSTGIVIPWIVIGKFVTSPKGRFLSPCTLDRKSTRLNSSHSQISYAVFCLKKKKVIKYFLLLRVTTRIQIARSSAHSLVLLAHGLIFTLHSDDVLTDVIILCRPLEDGCHAL